MRSVKAQSTERLPAKSQSAYAFSIVTQASSGLASEAKSSLLLTVVS
jgi:hypothetical protein